MGLVAVHFELYGKLCRHYPLFHISLLHGYLPSGDRVDLSAPVIIEDADEFKVEALIAHE